MKKFDQSMSALITDLDRRGLLESTMVTVIRYLETLMRAEQPMFTTDAECEVFCREKLEQHLMAKLEALLL